MPPSSWNAVPMTFPAETLPILNLSSTLPTASTTVPNAPNCFFASSMLPPRTRAFTPFTTSAMGLNSAATAPTRIPSTSLRLSACPRLSSTHVSRLPMQLPMFSKRSPIGLSRSSSFPRIIKAVLPTAFTPFSPMLNTRNTPVNTFCTFSAVSSLSAIFPVSSSNPFRKLYSGLPSVMNTSPNPSRIGLNTLLMPSSTFRMPLKKCSRPLSWFILPARSSRFTLPF